MGGTIYFILSLKREICKLGLKLQIAISLLCVGQSIARAIREYLIWPIYQHSDIDAHQIRQARVTI